MQDTQGEEKLTKYVKRMYILTSESKTRITVGQYSLVTNELWLSQRHTKVFVQKYISRAFHGNVHVFMGAIVPKKGSHDTRVLLYLLVSFGTCSFGELISKRMHK